MSAYCADCGEGTVRDKAGTLVIRHVGGCPNLSRTTHPPLPTTTPAPIEDEPPADYDDAPALLPAWPFAAMRDLGAKLANANEQLAAMERRHAVMRSALSVLHVEGGKVDAEDVLTLLRIDAEATP